MFSPSRRRFRLRRRRRGRRLIVVASDAAAAAAAVDVIGFGGVLRLPRQSRRGGTRMFAAARSRRPGRLPGLRDAVHVRQTPQEAVPAVFRAGPPIRPGLCHDHGHRAVRRRQRLPVNQRSAHHQRVQVRRPHRFHQVQRAVRRRPQQL